jgi:hypothetical protein
MIFVLTTTTCARLASVTKLQTSASSARMMMIVMIPILVKETLAYSREGQMGCPALKTYTASQNSASRKSAETNRGTAPPATQSTTASQTSASTTHVVDLNKKT